MSNVKGQVKWLVKHFSGVVLLLLIVAGALAYFTNTISVNNFRTIAYIVVIAVLVLGYYGFMNVRSALIFAVIGVAMVVGVMVPKTPAINANQFQAVTLTSGQTYYGHLTGLGTPYATVKDVYTLQATQQPTTSNGKATTKTEPVLIKLSTGPIGSEDQITIKADKIVSWQNLQDSSKLVQAIKKDLAK